MKEHSIVFNTETVHSLLNGTKTMTRRVVSSHPIKYYGEYCIWKENRPCYWSLEACSYQVGDKLWVRETYYIEDSLYNPTKVHYKEVEPHYAEYENVKWLAPVTMPRWASRIERIITNIRAERLQDITLKDIKAEGIWIYYEPWEASRMRFARLWDSSNKKQGYSWEDNPWVLIYELQEVK